MEHSKLDRKAEASITKDWQAEMPALGTYKPRRLLRRVDSLLVGICLERDSSAEIYKPIFHVHFLGFECSCISLSLGTQLRTMGLRGPDYIEVRNHKEKYKEAASRMKKQSLLPLAGDLYLSEVERAYRAHLATAMGRLMAPSLFRDMIRLRALAGEAAPAAELLAESLQLPERADFKFLGGREAFAAECKRLIESPEIIRQMVEHQIVAHGVQHLPVSRMLN